MLPKTGLLSATLLALCLASFSSPSAAATAEDAIAALNAQKYAEALDILRPLADGGDPQAQYFLGTLYRDGRGVAQDHKASCTLFEKAAEQGPPAAMHMTGLCFGLGLTGAIDNAKAIAWLTRSIERNFAPSMCALGNLYANGSGVEKNPTKAFELCQQGAIGGDASAQDKLGLFYYAGFGTG